MVPMALYTYDGAPLTFPTIRLVDGSQLVAEPGGTYDLAEETSDPRFTSVASAPVVTSITTDPATTGSSVEATVPSQTAPDGPGSPNEQENA